MPSIDVRREDLAAGLRAIGPARASDPPYAHLTKLTLGADEVFCPFKMSQLGAQVHWTPPSCATFVDQTPQLLRFFSITADD